jgi:hypothetical protein
MHVRTSVATAERQNDHFAFGSEVDVEGFAQR